MSQSPQPAARASRFSANLNNWASVLFAAAIFVMVNYLGYRYYWRKDFSPTRFYELSPKTLAVLKSLKEPIKVTAYYGGEGDVTVSERLRQEVELLFRQYKAAAGDKLEIEHVDPALETARAEDVVRKFKLAKQDNLLIFQLGERNQKVAFAQLAEFDRPDYLSNRPARMKSFSGEAMFTAALASLLEGKAAKVYFLAGQGERDFADSTGLSGAGRLVEYILRENIELAALNLSATPAVPDDAQAVLILGPQTAFTAQELTALVNYLDGRKGKVLAFVDPLVNTGLESLALKYGIKLENDIAMLRGLSMEHGGKIVNSPFAVVDNYGQHPITKILEGYNLHLYRARSMTLASDADRRTSKVVPLLFTPASYWSATNPGQGELPFDPTKNPLRPLVLGALYDAGMVAGGAVNVEAARLLVVGSSSFLTNQYINDVGVNFFVNALNWMVKKDATLGIGAKTPKEYRMVITERQTYVMSLLACVALPGVALIWGGLVWFSRRR
jgi:ABC-type uncharacterized transport system involved in gliding motility auxiliary subunit